MSFSISTVDIAAVANRKPKAKAEVPTIRFDVPPVTTETILKAVETGRGPWTTLQQLHEEDIATRHAKKLSDRYDFTEIPAPQFESEDWHL